MLRLLTTAKGLKMGKRYTSEKYPLTSQSSRQTDYTKHRTEDQFTARVATNTWHPRRVAFIVWESDCSFKVQTAGGAVGRGARSGGRHWSFSCICCCILFSISCILFSCDTERGGGRGEGWNSHTSTSDKSAWLHIVSHVLVCKGSHRRFRNRLMKQDHVKLKTELETYINTGFFSCVWQAFYATCHHLNRFFKCISASSLSRAYMFLILSAQSQRRISVRPVLSCYTLSCPVLLQPPCLVMLASYLLIFHFDEFLGLHIRSGQRQDGDGTFHSVVLSQFTGKDKRITQICGHQQQSKMFTKQSPS